jgi:peptidoglycan/xylan/chitin deacetylase (PgdA/CDA1 family)
MSSGQQSAISIPTAGWAQLKTKRVVRLFVLYSVVIGCVVAGFLMLPLPAASQDNPATPPAWDGTLRRINVPILMYHYVSELPADADQYRQDLTISPAVFQAHMQYLWNNGYTTISLYQLNDALMRGTPLPVKPVVLTFDDGYIDHYVNVFPVLKQYNFTATFFIITGMPDGNDSEYVSWQQIREMSDAGMSMESHTKTHSDLRGRAYDFLVYELLGSMQSLQAYTGKEPHMFAYPIGHYDDNTLAVLQTLPVWRAVTTQPGALETTDNALELPRIRIHGTTGVNGLASLLQSR